VLVERDAEKRSKWIPRDEWLRLHPAHGVLEDDEPEPAHCSATTWRGSFLVRCHRELRHDGPHCSERGSVWC
jgi:hypothetical protein